jgi:adenylate cyclase
MANLLGAFFALVVDCVDWYGGTVDKFIGVTVMATFGLPAAADDDADRAVDAACDMLRKVDSWNAARAASALEVCIGIGIDTGIV